MKKALPLLISLLLSAGVSPAATSPKPGTLTPGTYTLTQAGAYTLPAVAGEIAEYTLTSDGKEIESNLIIQTKISDSSTGTVSVTLNNLQILHKTPVVVYGAGTVIFKTADVYSQITHTGRSTNSSSTDSIIKAEKATLRFQCEKRLLLKVSNNVSSMNVVPIKAPSVSFESGELVCYAQCSEKYADSYPLAPIIDAATVTISGDTTVLQLGFAAAQIKIYKDSTNAYKIEELINLQHSPIKCTTLTCTGGTIRHAISTNALPEETFKTGTVRYAYPDSSFTSLIEQAQGGTILNKKIFHFPDWTPVAGADYSACFTNAVPAALTVNPDARTIAVDLSTSPDAEPVYSANSCADAATLFGADAVPTPKGLKVAYAFGITRIGAVTVESGLAVSVRLGVRLPKETADTATFLITVTDDAKQTVYQDNTLFTRLEGSDLFETADLATSDCFAELGLGTAAYTVTASEAASKP